MPRSPRVGLFVHEPKGVSMTLKNTFVAFTAVLLPLSMTGVSVGAEIEDRQAKMKTVGKSIGIVSKMAKGESDFDSTIALKAFVDMKEAAKGFQTLFPEGTETGGETEAAPAIFSDRAGFEAKQSEFLVALEAATASAPADIGALRATLGSVGKNCGACHETYRVKKN